jgi:hypothetical protein
MRLARPLRANKPRDGGDHPTLLDYIESTRGLLLAATGLVVAITALLVALLGRG